MHYIRFLKSPRFVGSGNEKALVAKITITTDLGESFLAADVGIIVDVVAEDGKSILGPGRGYLWKGREGMRSLDVSLLMKKVRELPRIRMCVAARGDANDDTYEGVLGLDNKAKYQGGIVTIRSVEIDSSTGQPMGTGLAERVFSSKDKADSKEIHIWEETGESIARHIWDAGLILSSYIATPRHLRTSLPRLPLLETSLSQANLNVLELGAGCGIVSITLLHTFLSVSQILLTDLPEASEILSHNLSPTILRQRPSKISHQVLDWSLPLPANVGATKWDLVFVADCTYNPDVVPDLVTTLGRIAEGKNTRVVVAMKVRHESEIVFFTLMEERGFVVMEKGVVPLPVLGGENEEIEIYIFGYRP